MESDSCQDARRAVLEAKLRLLRAAADYQPMGFVCRRPWFWTASALLAGFLAGWPFRTRTPAGIAPQVVKTCQGVPLTQMLSLATTLIPLFFSRASSSGG